MKIAKDQLLVIIDPQKDFISTQGAYSNAHDGIDQMLVTKRKINALLKVVPENQVVVIYSDYQHNQFAKGVSLCIPGTEGHQIDIEITPLQQLICKTAHSCFSSNHFCEYLQAHQVKGLLLAGFLAEYCVKQTALDGLSLGYQIAILSDLIATGDDVQERKTLTLTALSEAGATIIKKVF